MVSSTPQSPSGIVAPIPSVLPAPSRRFFSSTSASGLLRRSRSSSCVSSPIAKYASCWRTHSPQKATPRISTSALRGQGLSVLLRTWQGPGFVTSVNEPSVPQLLERLLEGVARAEGGNLLGRDLHLLAGLGVSALHGLEVLLGLALGHRGLLGDPLDELLLLHGYSFLWSSSAS